MPSPESTPRRTSTPTSRPPRPPASKRRRIAWWVGGGLALAGVAGGGLLRGPDSLEVACWFAESDAGQAASLTPGSRVTLVGRWSGEGTSSQELVLRFCQRR